MTKFVKAAAMVTYKRRYFSKRFLSAEVNNATEAANKTETKARSFGFEINPVARSPKAAKSSTLSARGKEGRTYVKNEVMVKSNVKPARMYAPSRTMKRGLDMLIASGRTAARPKRFRFSANSWNG